LENDEEQDNNDETSTSNSSNKSESSLDKFAQKLGFFKFLFGKILVTLLCL
jgi:hypothetical protein